MAKSKRSAALFEVIQSSRLPKSQGPLFAKRWWFPLRSNKPSPFQMNLPAATATAGGASVADVDDFEPITDLAPVAVAAAAQPHAAPAPSFVASTNGHHTAKQAVPGVDWQLDPDHQQITFKVSYNSAIVTAFTVMITIGLAFLVGRRMNHGPIAATASPSTAELRSQPAHPDVLDVGKPAIAQNEPDAIVHPADNAQLAAINTPTTAPSVDSQRIIGRQYVVIQIYPEKKSADDAAALLNQNNIPCTVENGLTGWASKSWWCVVGTTGFDHIRGNAAYKSYEAAVNRVSDQFAANSKFKKFEPRAYRWKESTT